jgi:hypothetical protein
VVGSCGEAGSTAVSFLWKCPAAEFASAERRSGAGAKQSSGCVRTYYQREAKLLVGSCGEAGSTAVSLLRKCPAAEFASAERRTTVENGSASGGQQSAKPGSGQRRRETGYGLVGPAGEAGSAAVQR